MKKILCVVLMLASMTCFGDEKDEDNSSYTVQENTHGEFVTEDELVWDGIVSFVCLVQDESYEESWYGEALINDGEFLDWKKTMKEESLRCLKEKKLVPKALCSELFGMNKNAGQEFIKNLYIKHKETIDHIEKLNECER